MNYYERLGIAATCSKEQIKQAFRKQAKTHHPDAGGSNAEFSKIQEAYNVLIDDTTRRSYDSKLAGVHVNIKFNDVFNDVFTDMHNSFGYVHTPRTRNRNIRNKDLTTNFECSLKDTLTQQDVTISVRHLDGTRHFVKCTIPIGIDSGATIKYQGLGDATLKVPPGDLFLKVNVLEHPVFVKVPKSRDLATDVTISFWDSILGCNITIESIEDKKLNITIPASTQYGTFLNVRGHGVLDKNKNRGDLIVRVLIKTPQNLSTEQLNIIKGWQ
jgi:curved DNA-binding protein